MTVLETRPETKRKLVYHSTPRVEEWEVIPQERKPEVNIGSVSESELCVERKDITFQDVPGGKVRIHVTVHNRSGRTSSPTMVRLESAPLGAFVPWKPLAEMPVKALKPGESVDLVTEVPRPRPTSLGNFDRVPPKKLLTALNSPDASRSQADLAASRKMTSVARWIAQGLMRSNRQLPPDLMELLGRPNPYWAGNLNVFIGSKPVERHMAQALRIFPGRTNLAYFMVGGPRRGDAYAFELEGLSPDWEARLYDATNSNTLVVGASDAPIAERHWIESHGGLAIVLAAHPPADCQEGNLYVHVTQRSSGKSAIVEFNLSPSARGAGCYTV